MKQPFWLEATLELWKGNAQEIGRLHERGNPADKVEEQKRSETELYAVHRILFFGIRDLDDEQRTELLRWFGAINEICQDAPQIAKLVEEIRVRIHELAARKAATNAAS